MSARFLPALCSVTFRRQPAEAIIALARQAGIAALEWGGDVHVPPGDLAHASAVATATRAAGLAVASYGSYIAPPTDGLEAFELALRTTVALGAPNIRIWPGTRNRDSVEYTDAARASTVSLIQTMGDMAARHGVTVGLEYHPGSLTDTAASAAQLMAEIGHDNVFLYWQPRPGQPGKAQLAEIAAVGRHVSHVHVFAWDAQKQRYPLAAQVDDWHRALCAMPDSRFAGPRYAMLEFVRNDSAADFTDDAATLRALLDETAG